MADLIRFFEAVWPDAGWYAIAVLTHRGMRHRYFRDKAEAAAYALAEDRRGAHVFFGCASYRDPAGGRKAENVQCARCYWVDLDVGPGKPYASQREAVLALGAAVRAVGLPAPLVVSSGQGLHVYWPMNADMTPSAWRVTATILKAALAKAGLEADHARTADLASVLRPPGSTHRKGETLEVRVLKW